MLTGPRPTEHKINPNNREQSITVQRYRVVSDVGCRVRQAGFYVDEGTFPTIPAHFMWPVAVAGVGQGINTTNVVFCPSS